MVAEGAGSLSAYGLSERVFVFAFYILNFLATSTTPIGTKPPHTCHHDVSFTTNYNGVLFTTPSLTEAQLPCHRLSLTLLSAVANLRAQGEEEAARELVGRLLFFGVLFGFFLIPILQVRGRSQTEMQSGRLAGRGVEGQAEGYGLHCKACISPAWG